MTLHVYGGEDIQPNIINESTIKVIYTYYLNFLLLGK